MDGFSVNQFKSLHVNGIPIVEDPLTLSILDYDIEVLDGNIIKGLNGRSVQNCENTAKMFRYSNHRGHVRNINAASQSFRCTICDTFFKRTFNFKRKLNTCSE